MRELPGVAVLGTRNVPVIVALVAMPNAATVSPASIQSPSQFQSTKMAMFSLQHPAFVME
jgi:hypothetical protein